MVTIPKTLGPVGDWHAHTSLAKIGRPLLPVAGYSDLFLSPRERFVFCSGFRCEHRFANEWHKKRRAEQDRNAPQMRLEEGF
jgi:hypothetical protein